MNMKRISEIARKGMFFMMLSIVCVLQFSGCGYTTRSMIADKYKTIYITQFVNKINITHESDAEAEYKLYRPLLELDITKSVINRFLFDGNLKPVKSEDADLILKGELVEFKKDALRYTSSDEVEEYRVSIKVNLSLWNTKENKLVWEEKDFTGDTTYFTQGISAKTDNVAANDAVDDLSRRIVERTVEQW